MNKSDLRYIQCEQLIMDALIDLIEKKGFRSITVKDIALKATINRKTFYNHYESVDALFSQIVGDTIAKLFEGVVEDNPLTTPKNLEDRIKQLLNNLSLNKRILSILMNDQSSHELIKQLCEGALRKFLAKSVLVRPTEQPLNVPSDLLMSSLEAVFIAFMRWCIQNRDFYSDDEIVRILLELLAKKSIQ